MKTIFFRDFEVQASVGLLQEEKQHKQPLLINLEFSIEAGTVRTLEETVDYAKVREVILAYFEQGHYELLEGVVEDLSALLTETFQLKSLKLSVEKTEIFQDVAGVGVTLCNFNTPCKELNRHAPEET